MKHNELVINYHVTESCNYRCRYCYASWAGNCSTAEIHHQPTDFQALITQLADFFIVQNNSISGLNYHSVRLNFAGGEPLMLGRRLWDAIDHARSLGFKTSIITNGHFLTEKQMPQIAAKLDVLGISFDTSLAHTQTAIARMDKKGRYLTADKLIALRNLYQQHHRQGEFKVNTVVNQLNCGEDFNALMRAVCADRWKFLRVLPVYDDKLLISDAQYQLFKLRHQHIAGKICFEDNEDMWQSYLMINPLGQFYQNGSAYDGLTQSAPILEVGVAQALSQIHFSAEKFSARYQVA